MTDTVLNIKGLSVNFGKKRVLTNIFLEVKRGFIYGLIGPNGAGKSTLFDAILGMVESLSGQISVFGDPVDIHRHRIAYIPQKDKIDWDFPTNVREVVMQGRYPHKRVGQWLNAEDRDLAQEAMQWVHIEHLADRQISKLSGGQQQRVFIARALCQKADIYLLDEPFVGVDHLTESRIIEVLTRLKEEGKTILVVHHDLATVTTYFDRLILLNQRLIEEGAVEEVFTMKKLQETFGPQLTVLQKAGLMHK